MLRFRLKDWKILELYLKCEFCEDTGCPRSVHQLWDAGVPAWVELETTVQSSDNVRFCVGRRLVVVLVERRWLECVLDLQIWFVFLGLIALEGKCGRERATDDLVTNEHYMQLPQLRQPT